MSNGFPSISIAGEAVNAKDHVAKGTGLALFGAVIVGILGILIAIPFTYGLILIALLISPLVTWAMRKKAAALIHGSGVCVSEAQFPEIHACVQEFRARLGLRQDVEVYIVEDNVANAAAVRFGRKNVVLLTDDIIHACLASGAPYALAFVIGHELAHVALNHNGAFRNWTRKAFKKLSRLDEYSADAVATALVGDRTIAYHGLMLLTIGYAMLPYANPEAILQQAREVAANRHSRAAERTLTHPMLLNRIHRVVGV